MNGKSIWAVVAGLLFIFAASILIDIVLHVVGIGGGWLTARLAPDKPMKHALILGAVGIVLGLLGVVLTWNQNLGPRWYAIALAVLAVPQCWLGGKLFEARSGKR